MKGNPYEVVDNKIDLYGDDSALKDDEDKAALDDDKTHLLPKSNTEII